ncbi:hypothetical protein M409DRAFT_71290 [Zasmidium cellare ATCC 36951]|uniref:FAD/NAD(P)-binding domain-containing protein n=1 Tax=Zasmidium cellare ATCC 36951 TaxID=1080233 RepID=A0A6A6BW22_ZASCE|nr:uncharacterized protein M409DRAFT_71290 [Zasmidium cellare ATCC 36951]KAF2159044.1 hypothetical protein M409DRAFT_71290 [Zasmidium cellare ATCC 36951]
MGSLPSERRLRAKSVCIIGAGPTGLAAAKYLLAEKAFDRIAVVEQRSEVGGIWNYTPCDDEPAKDLSVPQTSPHAGVDKPVWRNSNAAHVLGEKEEEEAAAFITPLYDRLETNIPRGLMGFSDLDWPEDCQLFPRHNDVLDYLKRYAHDVRHLIEFRTQVLDVSQLEDGRWSVQTQEVQRNVPQAIQEHIFDAVIVANGHYDVPYIPSVPGIEAWHKSYPGAITHSKFYRKPEYYTGKKVIVIGNSASGIDIGTQIGTVSTTLILSQKSESYLGSVASPNKVEKPEIVEFIEKDRSVRFADGTNESDIDARVENTYRHFFYRPNPTLALLALNQKVIPFSVAEAQSAVVARVLAGRLALPDEATMKPWEEDVVADAGNGKSFHVLKFPKDADYINSLHDWALQADAGGKVVGKTPPYWREKDYWTREQFPAIKKAFQEFGDERHNKRTLEDVGFSFEQWQAGSLKNRS